MKKDIYLLVVDENGYDLLLQNGRGLTVDEN
jgi:hypothetical protein